MLRKGEPIGLLSKTEGKPTNKKTGVYMKWKPKEKSKRVKKAELELAKARLKLQEAKKNIKRAWQDDEMESKIKYMENAIKRLTIKKK